MGCWVKHVQQQIKLLQSKSNSNSVLLIESCNEQNRSKYCANFEHQITENYTAIEKSTETRSLAVEINLENKIVLKPQVKLF